MTKNDNGPGPGRNYGETAVFTFGRKVFFWPKMGFNPKNHPKFLKRLIFIWEKATFFFGHWPFLILFKLLHLLLHGFVRSVIWICQSCSMLFTPIAKQNQADV